MKIRLFIFALAGLAAACLAQIQDGRWVETFQWQGYGIMQTEKFPVFGQKWRVRYRTLKNGPLQVVLNDFHNGSSKTVVKRAGGRVFGYQSYAHTEGVKYLSIAGGLNGWEVKVEQYLDNIEEWQYVKYLKHGIILEKKAVWAGDSPREFSVEMDSEWKLEFEQLSPGTLKVEVLDSEQFFIFSTQTDKVGATSAGWAYLPGKYTIRVSGSDALAWTIFAYRQIDVQPAGKAGEDK
ncbi:MAG: hypothetical protein GX564_10295 [Oligosphaeraceae bacterium]|nr:hypothetical protein [Oligosphaeraceae bacterium]